MQLVDVLPCLGFRRPVEEHQEDARDREHDEEEERQPTEAQRVADLHGMALHLHRVQVVQQRVHDHVAAVTRRIAVSLTEDRAGAEDRVPGLTALDLFDGLGQPSRPGGWLHWRCHVVLSSAVRRGVESG